MLDLINETETPTGTSYPPKKTVSKTYRNNGPKGHYSLAGKRIFLYTGETVTIDKVIEVGT